MRDRGIIRITPPGAGAEVVEELTRLERRRVRGLAGDEELARIEALPGELAAALERETIVLVLRVATRRGGMRRERLRREVLGWLRESGHAETPIGELPAEALESLTIMSQAAAIAGALVDDECVNFAPPDEIAGWLEVPDFLFAPALEMALALNPHWLPEAPEEEAAADGDSKNAGAPGSRSNGGR